MPEQYQSFLGKKGASDSYSKLGRLDLPNLKGKSFLDVGCNEGFFCGVAHYAGAARVVGIDINIDFIERAKQRFPAINFECLSWEDDLTKFGNFDVILLASAIHYADDQPGLIRKLLSRLSNRGILVLELGMVSADEDKYIDVERKPGEVRSYATIKALEKVLDGYVFRIIGRSVEQNGDPVPRWVLHVTRRRPTIILFDAPSFSGKSSLVRLISEPSGDKIDEFHTIAIDLIFRDIDESTEKKYPDHQNVIRKISDFKKSVSIFANHIMDMLGRESMIADFVRFVLDINITDASLILWDGYIPEKYQRKIRDELVSEGYVVWSTQPVNQLNYERLSIHEVVAEIPGGVCFRSANLAKCYLDNAILDDGDLLLIGWGIQIENKQPLEDFMIFFGENRIEPKVRRVSRPDANRQVGCEPSVMLGFEIAISSDQFSKLLTLDILFLGLLGKGDFIKRLLGLKFYAICSDGGVIEASHNSKIPIIMG